MYRVFITDSQINNGTVTITGPDAHHLKDVLRIRPGEKVYVCAGDEWEYTCVVEDTSEGEVTARITDAQKPGKELPSKITLFQCIPKKERMELAIQKSVELGAYAVVPVNSARCIVRLDDKKAADRVKRWGAIAAEAAKQSKRMIEPEVRMPLDFEEALEEASKADICLIPYEMAENMEETRNVLSKIEPGMSVSVLIGPEGGFEESEAALAVEKGFRAVTLGKRILRTETAGPAILAILGYLLER